MEAQYAKGENMRFIKARVCVLGALFVSASAALANHPVLVEGNCDLPVPGSTIVTAGFCGDFDGDGRIGTAEDTDGADRIFGTITAALGLGTGAAAGTGANQNGQITIVTSGRFAETLIIKPEGNLTLQAAPGVEATIDAVLQGDPAGGNNARQDGIGISIQPRAGRHQVIVRNLTVRNFTIGIDIRDSDVSLVDVRVANNANLGIRVREGSKVSIDRCDIIATGFREGTTGIHPTIPPNPGAGIIFRDSSSGLVSRTGISHNFGPGIFDQTSGTVTLQDNYIFGNNPNTLGL